MNPIRTKLLIAAMLAITTAMTAIAGNEKGNGGGVWVCRDASATKSIRWVELVDLYEGTHDPRLGLNIPRSSNPYRSQIDEVTRKISQVDPVLAEKFQKEIDRVLKAIVPTQANLSIIDDSLTTIEPELSDCSDGLITYEQFANYTPDGTILRRSALWLESKLSETDRAALIVHEAIYARFRQAFDQTDSRSARKLTAYLFSTAPIATYLDELKNALIGGVFGGTTLNDIPVDSGAVRSFIDNAWYSHLGDRLQTVEHQNRFSGAIYAVIENNLKMAELAKRTIKRFEDLGLPKNTITVNMATMPVNGPDGGIWLKFGLSAYSADDRWGFSVTKTEKICGQGLPAVNMTIPRLAKLPGFITAGIIRTDESLDGRGLSECYVVKALVLRKRY